MMCEPAHSGRACANCNRARAKEWYENNRERAMASHMDWAKANKEKIAGYRKNRRADPEKKAKSDAASKKWKNDNPDRVREHCRDWRANNREKSRTLGRNRRARVLSAEGSHSREDVADILKMQSGKCAYCRVRLNDGDHTVDHIKPVSKGGSNDRKNLQILCISCNCRKSACDPVDFARRIGRLI